ncbi:Uncharacterised protein [Streptococcus pneumoniae]|nr:Uncharacterised protein [Streptococcus pneumoniae]VKH30604.1 Uncharacterised protein [Streptococcus pneumoniae]VLT71916.1 Uncharacterised protein [Streptococcus pneumoniae]VLY53695.1 Uncharacterised protein [Streptococcus pneumoniae]VMK93451.1 Uncharacterised protein [Streptococcus pneumoniae]
MAEKKTYRIQGTVTLEEREQYVKLKEKIENEELQGVRISDGQFITLLVKKVSMEKD